MLLQTSTIEGAELALPRMRIAGIRVHRLSASLKERFGYSLNWTATRGGQLVEVLTDVGLSGWGDGACDVEPIQKNPELVIGRSPFELEAIYQGLRRPGPTQGRPGAPSSPGLDMALWDLVGKAINRPVCDLFGKRYRSRVQAYVTALYRKDWPDLCEGLANEARGWIAAGYRAMKMKIGFSPELDLEIASAVRDAIGSRIALGVDSNCAYDLGTAVRLGAHLDKLDLMWWEEPLVADAVLIGLRAPRWRLAVMPIPLFPILPQVGVAFIGPVLHSLWGLLCFSRSVPQVCSRAPSRSISICGSSLTYLRLDCRLQ